MGISSLVGFSVLWVMFRTVKKDVEEALKNATTEEQEVIRNKVVKALFPPRFYRD